MRTAHSVGTVTCAAHIMQTARDASTQRNGDKMQYDSAFIGQGRVGKGDTDSVSFPLRPATIVDCGDGFSRLSWDTGVVEDSLSHEDMVLLSLV